MEAKKTTTVSAKLDRELARRLTDTAKSLRVDKSEFIRAAVEEKILAWEGTGNRLSEIQTSIEKIKSEIVNELAELRGVSRVVAGIVLEIKTKIGN